MSNDARARYASRLFLIISMFDDEKVIQELHAVAGLPKEQRKLLFDSDAGVLERLVEAASS